MKALKYFVVLSVFTSQTLAQQQGMPFYRTYEPQEYQGHRQNWAIAQEEDGTMHFANEGLLTFNGENWQLNMVPNQRHLRSLATGHNRIYVGGNNELGYFEQVGKNYRFTSFLKHVPDSLKNFDRVWTTLIHRENVYYQTDTFILRVSQDDKSKLWPFTSNNVWKLLLLDDAIHIDVPNKGFFVLNKQDAFDLIPNGEKLRFVGIEYFIRLKQGWLFEQRDTLKIFDGNTVSKFKNEAVETFLEFGIDKAIKTKMGDLVFTTRRKGGVIILNEDGTLKDHLKPDSGFSDHIIRNIFEDKNGSIWFALDTGISRLDLYSPLRFFNSDMGLNGTVSAIQPFNHQLFIGTTDGLKVMEDTRFAYVDEITAIIQDLDTIKNHLIVATSLDKLYSIAPDLKKTVIDHSKTQSKGIFLEILIPEESNDSFLCLYEEGVFQVQWEKGSWAVKQDLHGAFKDAQNLIQEKPGTLWIDTGVSGFYRVTYDVSPSGEFDLSDALIKNYFSNEGVPLGDTKMYNIHGNLIVAAPNGNFLRFNESRDQFEEIPSFWQVLENKAEDSHLSTIWPGSQRDIPWIEIEQNGRPFLMSTANLNEDIPKYLYPLNTFASRFGDLRGAKTFHASGEKVFYGGINGVMEYNTKLRTNISEQMNVAISSVATSNTIYHDISEFTVNPIRYDNDKLVFEFTSTFFKDAENKTYRYKLEGFDKEWSHPSSNNLKEYTNLSPGSYSFRVKALNDYFVESPEATIDFTVNRPWYWNSISIPFYILGLGVFTYFFSQWRTRNLKLKNLRLEEAVNSAVAETKRQAAEITELYKVKNQFFSNISHELRTPLTLILGPSTDMVDDENLTPKQKNELTFINNNAKRLLRLINQLLDLSKLEAGKLDLKVAQQNIVKFISTITESFDSMAISRKIRLKFHSDLKELYLFFDQDTLEQIIINLLSNALKFTKEGGKVTVSVNKKDDLCKIEVTDSGIGINAEQLPYVFDRFYQADNSESREHEGTGIGLSLTKELVELHGGSITASSEPGKGSTFLITLPLGKEHFQEHQLAKFTPIPKDKNVSKMEALIEEAEMEGPEVDEEVILLVEDNTEMRTYIKGLMLGNYAILEAANGLEGLNLAKKHVPDLIISDVMMPKMDGTELCQRLKKNEITSHIPIILLTAKASEEDRIKGLNNEADAYLAKPFNKAELRAQVRNLVLTRKKLQKRFSQSTLISPKEIAITSMEEQFLEKLVIEIENHIGDEHYSVEQMAQSMNLSRSQLHRKMISITDQTPSLFIRKYRLERAKQLLEKSAGRVSDIAFQVGFSSPSYFTKCFVEAFGITPKNLSKSDS